MTNPPLEIPVDSGRPEAAASLWAGQQMSLVGDRRATARGDILTVVIEIDDRAEMSNSSGRSRSAGSATNGVANEASSAHAYSAPEDSSVRAASSWRAECGSRRQVRS